jgi:hypothetical protein
MTRNPKWEDFTSRLHTPVGAHLKSQAISKSTQVSVAGGPARSSNLHRLGISEKVIQQILRNADVTTTMNIYAKRNLINRGPESPGLTVSKRLSEMTALLNHLLVLIRNTANFCRMKSEYTLRIAKAS